MRPWRGHQSLTDPILANDLQHPTMHLSELVPKCMSGMQHSAVDGLQHRMSVDELQYPPFKSTAAHLADLQTIATQKASNAQLHVTQFSLQQFATGQKRTDILRAGRL